MEKKEDWEYWLEQLILNPIRALQILHNEDDFYSDNTAPFLSIFQ